MIKFYLQIGLILFLSCGDSGEKAKEKISSKITNPIFLEMFNEYQSIIDDYEMIVSSLDADNFNSIPEVESITKRATAWIDKWEKEIKNANLSNKEKIEIINEYEKLFENYKK